jgi:hypothetical protein
MTVGELIQILSEMPSKMEVHLDDEGYPSITSCIISNDFKEAMDDEDKPPANIVLLRME